MQIDLNKLPIKEFLKLFGWILLFVSLWFKGCSKEGKSETIVKVKVPEVKAVLEAKKPDQKPIDFPKKGETIYRDNPLNAKLSDENEKLKLDYAKMSDSLRSKAYEMAIELNNFSTKFEDENLLLNINGTVRGEVQEVTPSYVIKSKELSVPLKQKESVFRVLGGLEMGNTLQLDNFKVKGNLMFQNRKGNIISTSFDTQQTFWVGYNFSIFNIKR
ncbi:hypothetical protein [Flavobacterium lipolyticum]|uniref:DUF4251 domain-containing protein n=1 Tax=Flavobacterium lipolyticum TaxID=2893754 RepID=A0ABS8LWH1_9FLAO|nr:hypothetical protein [Flavobacterium sp. F-126]MCC9016915.1 hypothetical protein [Flavobacterium sp. F-126]